MTNDRLDELLTDLVSQARYLAAHEIIRDPRALPQAQRDLEKAKAVVRAYVTVYAQAIRHIAERLRGAAQPHMITGEWVLGGTELYTALRDLDALAEELDAVRKANNADD